MARRFRFAALVLLLAVVPGLAACGGGDPDATKLLQQTFGPDQSIRSGRLGISLGLDAQGLKSVQGPVSLKLSGPFESAGKGKLPKLDLSLTLGGGGAGFSAGAVSTGDKGFLKVQGTAFAVDDATFARFKEGYERSATKDGASSGPTFSSLGVDPLRWLRDPAVAGTEDVAGTETYHVTAAVDVPRFLDDLDTVLGKAGQLGGATAGQVPTKLTARQKRDIAASVKDARLDVWTGKDDKALRRLKLLIDIDVPQDVRKRAGGLQTGTLTFDLSISGLNEPQTITAPANARPLSELQSLLGGGTTSGAGGQGGGGGQAGGGAAPSGGSTGPGAATAPGSSSSKYLDCVAAAGSDVAKIQGCAELAGQ